MTIEEIAKVWSPKDDLQMVSFCLGAREQRERDIKLIPKLFLRWIMIDDAKPTWEEYANKAMDE